MSEPALIQEQRTILRRLRQTMAQHIQFTAPNAQERDPTTTGQCKVSRTLDQVIARQG